MFNLYFTDEVTSKLIETCGGMFSMFPVALANARRLLVLGNYRKGSSGLLKGLQHFVKHPDGSQLDFKKGLTNVADNSLLPRIQGPRQGLLGTGQWPWGVGWPAILSAVCWVIRPR